MSAYWKESYVRNNLWKIMWLYVRSWRKSKGKIQDISMDYSVAKPGFEIVTILNLLQYAWNRSPVVSWNCLLGKQQASKNTYWFNQDTMKTSPVSTSYKVRLQIEMQYSFPDAVSLQSIFCFGCPPGPECTLTRLLVTHNPNCLGTCLELRLNKISDPFWFISIHGHMADLQNM